MSKAPEAFRTISEVADWLDTPAHVLRFWESRFAHVKPVKRAGGRRYYRPNDMLLLGGIKKLLHEDGMTIRGAQKMLREDGVKRIASLSIPLPGDDVNHLAQELAAEPKAEVEAEEVAGIDLDVPHPDPENVVELVQGHAPMDDLDDTEALFARSLDEDGALTDGHLELTTAPSEGEQADAADPGNVTELTAGQSKHGEGQRLIGANHASAPDTQPDTPAPLGAEIAPDPEDGATLASEETMLTLARALRQQKAARGRKSAPLPAEYAELYHRLLTLRDKMAS